MAIDPATASQALRYKERSLLVTVNQLLGAGWSLGAVYTLNRADLDTTFPEPGGIRATGTPNNASRRHFSFEHRYLAAG